MKVVETVSLPNHPFFSALVSSFTRGGEKVFGGRETTTGNTSAVHRLVNCRRYFVNMIVLSRKRFPTRGANFFE